MFILEVSDEYQEPRRLNLGSYATFEHKCHHCRKVTEEMLPVDYSNPRYIHTLVKEMQSTLWYAHQTYGSLVALMQLFTDRCGGEPKHVLAEMADKEKSILAISDNVEKVLRDLISDLQKTKTVLEKQVAERNDKIQRALQVLQSAQPHDPEDTGEMQPCTHGDWIDIWAVVRAIRVLQEERQQ